MASPDPVSRSGCSQIIAREEADIGIAPGSALGLRAIMFDELPPTWLIDRDCQLLDANKPARKAAEVGEMIRITDNRLLPNIAGGEQRFVRAVEGVREESLFAWPYGAEYEIGLRLRVIGEGKAIAATLVFPPDPLEEIAPRLARRLNIPQRQSQLAAHLLVGHSVSGSAQAMGISRATANEYLLSLQNRLSVESRQTLTSCLLAAFR